MKFPKVIYVKVDTDTDENYLIAHDDLVEVGADGDVIGVYKFVETKRKKITEELV